MSKPVCEEIRLAAMAIADGEKCALTAMEIEAHLRECAECRQELDGMRILCQWVDSQTRPKLPSDFWPGIAPRLGVVERPAAPQEAWAPYILLVMVLVTGRGLAWATDGIKGLAVRFALVLFIVVLFWLLKQNPFAINTQLKHEYE